MRIGYRLGIDWVTIGVRLNRPKSITEFRPILDQFLTRSKAQGDGKGGGICFLPNVILSLGEESQMEQAGNDRIHSYANSSETSLNNKPISLFFIILGFTAVCRKNHVVCRIFGGS